MQCFNCEWTVIDHNTLVHVHTGMAGNMTAHDTAVPVVLCTHSYSNITIMKRRVLYHLGDVSCLFLDLNVILMGEGGGGEPGYNETCKIRIIR